MAGNKFSLVSDSPWNETREICGLWEVIRIYRDGEPGGSYLWNKDNFKFNFLPEMLFLCIRDGKTIHGSWELSEKSVEEGKQRSIILNGSFEFILVDIQKDEMTFCDKANYYKLIRRL